MSDQGWRGCGILGIAQIGPMSQGRSRDAGALVLKRKPLAHRVDYKGFGPARSHRTASSNVFGSVYPARVKIIDKLGD